MLNRLANISDGEQLSRAALALILLLEGCATVSVSDYAVNEPVSGQPAPIVDNDNETNGVISTRSSIFKPYPSVEEVDVAGSDPPEFDRETILENLEKANTLSGDIKLIWFGFSEKLQLESGDNPFDQNDIDSFEQIAKKCQLPNLAEVLKILRKEQLESNDCFIIGKAIRFIFAEQAKEVGACRIYLGKVYANSELIRIWGGDDSISERMHEWLDSAAEDLAILETLEQSLLNY